MLTGPRVSEGALAARAVAWGLDQPFYIQYFVWLQQVLTGNLGYSTSSFQPVSEMIFSHLGPTLLLMVTALVLSMAIALPLGIWSATHPYTKRGLCPGGAQLRGHGDSELLPRAGADLAVHRAARLAPLERDDHAGTGGGALDVLRHLAMPAAVLTVYQTGVNLRYIRSAMLDISQQDYLRTARAKGLGERRVIWKHGFRNILLTVITVVGVQIPPSSAAAWWSSRSSPGRGWA